MRNVRSILPEQAKSTSASTFTSFEKKLKRQTQPSTCLHHRSYETTATTLRHTCNRKSTTQLALTSSAAGSTLGNNLRSRSSSLSASVQGPRGAGFTLPSRMHSSSKILALSDVLCSSSFSSSAWETRNTRTTRHDSWLDVISKCTLFHRAIFANFFQNIKYSVGSRNSLYCCVGTLNLFFRHTVL